MDLEASSSSLSPRDVERAQRLYGGAVRRKTLLEGRKQVEKQVVESKQTVKRRFYARLA